jgi:putative hydrolase of the HAD superfamily
MEPPPVRGVVFDLDDTLLDHRGSATRALGRWLPRLGASPDAGVVAAWFEAEERHFPRWSAGEITFTEQRRLRLRDVLPAAGVEPGDDEELDRLFAGYLACYQASWTVFDDVAPTVRSLHRAGVAMAVLTNGLGEQQRAKVAATGLAHRLGPVLTPEETGASKPDPAAYLTACARLGLEPGVVLHVGDRHDLDVEAARAAGLRAVHLDRRGAGPTDEPWRISSLTDLPAG